MQNESKFICTQMAHRKKGKVLRLNINQCFSQWLTFLLINWSWVRVPPHPFLLNIKSFLGFRGRIPAGPRENTLKYNFKVHGRIKAREKSFDFSLAF